MILPSEHAGASSAGPLFDCGQLMSTPAAVAALTREEMAAALTRHLHGDWGELDSEDKDANRHALDHGLRLFSVYRSAGGKKFYIITEHDRSVTTVMMPFDY